MTAIARLVTTVGLAVAVLIGSTVTAGATFSEQVSASSLQVGTATLSPVTGFEVKYVVCDVYAVSAQVEWLRSPAADVSGYRVTAHLQNGQTELIAQVGPDVFEVPFTRDRSWLQRRPTFTVTMLTSYGWTSETGRSAPLSC
jgi:hypothetical protein